MKLNHVLVVYKKYPADAAEQSQHIRDHLSALESVPSILKGLNLENEFVDKDSFTTTADCDIIIAVGGDGTFLAASHLAGDIPMLGLNSMPGYSVGFFCAAMIKKLGTVLKDIIADKKVPKELPLISSLISGRAIKEDALNDILFAGHSPAEMARYSIQVADKKESQKSSGVWISAGPGSTAAMRSAGGSVFNIESKKLEYLVREPYHSSDKPYSMVNGVLNAGKEISITSEMKDAAIFIDGPSVHYPLKAGDVFTAKLSAKTLKVYL